MNKIETSLRYIAQKAALLTTYIVTIFLLLMADFAVQVILQFHYGMDEATRKPVALIVVNGSVFIMIFLRWRAEKLKKKG